MAYISAQGTPAATVTQHRLVRGATAIAVGDAASSRTQASAGLYSSVVDTTQQATIVFLDSPATTSSTTYKCQMRVNGSTGYVNRTSSDTDNANNARTISTITVMEIAALITMQYMHSIQVLSQLMTVMAQEMLKETKLKLTWMQLMLGLTPTHIKPNAKQSIHR